MSKRLELLDKLSKLGMEESFIKRQLNINFYNPQKRQEMFEKLEKVKKEVIEIKKQLSEEKRNKVENSDSN